MNLGIGTLLSGGTLAPPEGSVSPLAQRDGRGDRVGTPRWWSPRSMPPCPCRRSLAPRSGTRAGRVWHLRPPDARCASHPVNRGVRYCCLRCCLAAPSRPDSCVNLAYRLSGHSCQKPRVIPALGPQSSVNQRVSWCPRAGVVVPYCCLRCCLDRQRPTRAAGPGWASVRVVGASGIRHPLSARAQCADPRSGYRTRDS